MACGTGRRRCPANSVATLPVAGSFRFSTGKFPSSPGDPIAVTEEQSALKKTRPYDSLVLSFCLTEANRTQPGLGLSLNPTESSNPRSLHEPYLHTFHYFSEANVATAPLRKRDHWCDIALQLEYFSSPPLFDSAQPLHVVGPRVVTNVHTCMYVCIYIYTHTCRGIPLHSALEKRACGHSESDCLITAVWVRGLVVSF